MTVLQLYALLSPVIAFVVMAAFAAMLMRQTNRDIERLAEANAAREMGDTEYRVPGKQDQSPSQDRSYAQR
jgi:hypothetical protein